MDFRALFVSLLAGLVVILGALLLQSRAARRWRRRVRRWLKRGCLFRRSLAGPPLVEIDGGSQNTNVRGDLGGKSATATPPTTVAAVTAAPSEDTVLREQINEPVTASEAYEITTLHDFELLRARPDGVIVITDSGSHAKAHRTDCLSITETNFTKKVVDGESRGGRYYFFVRFDDAAKELSARWCMACAERNAAREVLPEWALREQALDEDASSSLVELKL